ncbi:MAG: transglutaminase-like domain-containing protein [Acetivibrionales bacterium]|jgi:transglutaminase-like putative cysteine protease
MKKLLVAIVIGLAVLVNPFAAAAANEPMIDTAGLGQGTISVSYNASQRLKIIIEKDDQQVRYDLRNDGIAETYPLQMGNGSYTISVLENVSGSKYRYISRQKIELKLENDNQVFLASVRNVNWNYEMEAIKKAEELTKGLKSDSEKIEKIYEYIVSNFTYDYGKISTLDTTYAPNIDNIFSSGKGICYDFSSVFAAMLRSRGIPAKLVKGYTTNVKGYHAWNEVYDSRTGEWIVIDTTYDAEHKAAGRAYSMIKETAHYSMVHEY